MLFLVSLVLHYIMCFVHFRLSSATFVLRNLCNDIDDFSPRAYLLPTLLILRALLFVRAAVSNPYVTTGSTHVLNTFSFRFIGILACL